MEKDETESVLVTDAAEEGKAESEDEENNEDTESEDEDSEEEDEQADEGWNADSLHASRMLAGGVGQALAYAGETRWM